MRSVFLAFLYAISTPLFADVQIESAKTPNVCDDLTTESPTSPMGVPDYTKVTGFVRGASLPQNQPHVLWNVSTAIMKPNGHGPTVGLSNAVAADGVIYFGDNLGSLCAVNVADQVELWSTDTGFRISAKPSVDADSVYFGSKNGVTALRRVDGRIIWEFHCAHGAGESTPIPVGKFLYASGYDGKCYCLHRKTGDIVWQHDFIQDAPADKLNDEFDGARARLDGILARPNGSACDGEIFIQSVFDQSRVIAIDCKTGKRCWAFQANGWISPAPTIANDRVYVASQDKHLYCLDRLSGQLIWKYDAKKWLASQVAVHEEKVYLAVHGARLHQISAGTGKLLQIMEPRDDADRVGSVYSFPLIAGQIAYFASGPGLLFAFDTESGEMKWKLRPSQSSELFTDPVTDGRRIYVTSRKNNKQEGEDAVFAIGVDD